MRTPRPTLVSASLVTLAAALGYVQPSLAQSASNFSFTAGDLVISVEGNGSNTAATQSGNTGASLGTYLDNQAAPLTLQEFSLTGTSSASLVGSLMLPQTSVAGGNNAISGEYGSSSEGTLQLSGNGQYLTIMGYGVNAQTYNSTQDLNGTGTALAQSPNSTTNTSTTQPNVSRVIALIGANGSVDTTTAISGVFNQNNPRSVYTTDGTSFYISGQGNDDSTGGVFYVSKLGATTATAITGIDTNSKSNGSYAQDTREVQIVNGQLTVSVDSSEGSKSYNLDGIGTLGSAGSPPTTTLNAQPTLLSGIGGKSTSGAITLSGSNGNSLNNTSGEAVYLSPNNYFYANSTTLYVADGGQPKNGSKGAGTNAPGLGGLQKWSLNTSTGLWSLDYTISSGLNLVSYTSATDGVSGLYGLTGKVVDGQVELFATSQTLADTDTSYLYGIMDTLSFTTASQASSESFATLETAAADTTIKGVAFAPVAPVPLPASAWMLLTGLAGLGALGLGRRSVGGATAA